MSRRPSGGGQLILFPGGAPGALAASPARRRRPRPASRSARMAERLDALVAAAEREAVEHRRAGDSVGERAAWDRASGARRAAELLRAGPTGVAEVLGGHHEAA